MSHPIGRFLGATALILPGLVGVASAQQQGAVFLRVYRPDGSIQCQPTRTTSVQDDARDLTDRHVRILRQERRHLQGVTPTGCGQPTGMVNAYLVVASDPSRINLDSTSPEAFRLWPEEERTAVVTARASECASGSDTGAPLSARLRAAGVDVLEEVSIGTASRSAVIGQVEPFIANGGVKLTSPPGQVVTQDYLDRLNIQPRPKMITADPLLAVVGQPKLPSKRSTRCTQSAATRYFWIPASGLPRARLLGLAELPSRVPAGCVGVTTAPVDTRWIGTTLPAPTASLLSGAELLVVTLFVAPTGAVDSVRTTPELPVDKAGDSYRRALLKLQLTPAVVDGCAVASQGTVRLAPR